MRRAAERRQAADEARKAALLAKQAAKSVPEIVPDAADGGSPNQQALLEPSEKDKRSAQAAARRQAAEDARKAELLQKRQAKAEKRETPDADHEVLRIELLLEQLPPGRAGDASRAGLKKQLMAAKAVAVREQRKREMAEREARKAQQQAAAQPRVQTPPQAADQQVD
jgi:colicin import membrane protein